MMKLAGLLVMFAMLSVGMAVACEVRGTPLFLIMVSGEKQCMIESFQETFTPENVSCERMSLTQQDKEVIAGTVNRFNTLYMFFGHIGIDKQTEQEYADFLKFSKTSNDDPCDCDAYENITRTGMWTTYKVRRDCPTETDCSATPPIYCESAPTTVAGVEKNIWIMPVGVWATLVLTTLFTIIFIMSPLALIALIIAFIIWLIRRKRTPKRRKR